MDTELRPGNTPATVEVAMVLDTADAEAFDHTLGQVAEILAQLGDPDPLEIRRARAVGILADPHTALDLFTPHVTTDQKRKSVTRPARPATLYLHLDQSALADLDTFQAALTATGLPHGLTVLSSDLLAMWLTGSTVFIKPLIDLTHPDQGGPPGQTHPDNLAPLCRGHHRAKTHHHWTYTRQPDGSYHWTNPLGHTFVVPPTPWR